MSVDYVLKSGAIFDGISEGPVSGGVAIEGNKIKGIFKAEDLDGIKGPMTKVIDYGDKLIMPGFIDSHMHAGYLIDQRDQTFCVDIAGAKTLEGLLEMMAGFAEKYPGNKVVFAKGLEVSFFGSAIKPAAKDLDKYFPDKPAIITSRDGYTYFANTKALEAAGLTKDTPDPKNAIEKDGNGEPTGVIQSEMTDPLKELLIRAPEERVPALISLLHEMNSYGLTSIGDLYVYGLVKPYPVYKMAEDNLTVRIHFYPSLVNDFSPESVEEFKREFNSPFLKFSGFKDYCDGTMRKRTIWMLEPYTDKPDNNYGEPKTPPEELKRKILNAASLGCAVRIHTNGDAANRFVLDIFEEAEEKYGKLQVKHSMEHLEMIDPGDIPRIAKLGVIASLQFRGVIQRIDLVKELFGEKREKQAHNWKSILDAGVDVTTGTDCPFLTFFDPMLTIFSGLTRTTDDGYPEGGWLPEQKLKLHEILRAYTKGGAVAMSRDDTGSLEEGKLADITVLDRNLFDIKDPKEVLGVRPVMTMVDGKIVYEKGA